MVRAPFSTTVLVATLGFLPASAAAQDLTGFWRANDGTQYIVRELGGNVCWSVSNPPYYANVFCGVRVGQQIFGVWLDLPNADSKGGGRMTLRVESPTRFVKETSSVLYGAESWTRVGAAPPPGPLDGLPGRMPGVQPPPLSDPPLPPRQAPLPVEPQQVIAGQTPLYGGGDLVLPASLSWESDGGVRGTWTRTESSIRWNAVYTHPNGRTVQTMEDVMIMGTSLTATRAISSEGIFCRLSGQRTQANPVVVEGTGDCYDNRTWRWKLTGNASPGLSTGSPAPGGAAAAGAVLSWQSDGWTGTWTRRGNSNVYDSNYSGPGGARLSAVEIVTITGGEVTIQRTNTSDGVNCTLKGQVQATPFVMRGYGECTNGARGWAWQVSAR